MFCPGCAAENGDNSRFCRRCGIDISLVPQALSHALPDVSQREDGASQYAVKIESSLKKSFIGLFFLLISITMLVSRNHEWWILLVPAAILLSKGISQILAVRYARLLIPPRVVGSTRADSIDQPRHQLLDSPLPPASVTEQTTRNMNPQVHQRPESQ